MHRSRSRVSRRQTPDVTVSKPEGDGRHSHLLQSFHAPFRRHINLIAARGSCFEDLAASFPGLLFALATGYGSVESRRMASAHIEAGTRLREAAAVLGLPWWTRKLPPQAFTQRLTNLPSDETFSTRIVNVLPEAPGIAGKWFERVLQAYRSSHAEFALWVAKHDRFHSPLVSDPALPYLAAWAWHSTRHDTLAGKLIRRPWTPTMSPTRAFDELTVWRKRLRLALCLSSLERETWLTPGSALGYEFVELRTIDDFIAESQVMDNCLDAFAEKLEAGVCHVFSIRENGVSIADVEIGTHPQEPQLPTIVQLRAPRNRRASPNVWRAAYAWLGTQSLPPAPPVAANSVERRRAWRALWKPYMSELEVGDRTAFERLAIELDRVGYARSRRRRQS